MLIVRIRIFGIQGFSGLEDPLAELRHKKFQGPLNGVCILKTRLMTGNKSHVLFFSSDLALVLCQVSN